MFATVVGAVLAFIFIGLPLAIIGLFIMSILDRRNKKTVEGYKESKLIGSGHLLRRAGSQLKGVAPHRLSRLAAERTPG